MQHRNAHVIHINYDNSWEKRIAERCSHLEENDFLNMTKKSEGIINDLKKSDGPDVIKIKTFWEPERESNEQGACLSTRLPGIYP